MFSNESFPSDLKESFDLKDESRTFELIEKYVKTFEADDGISAVFFYEECFFRAKEVFQKQCEKVQQLAENLVLKSNTFAMRYLCLGEFESALKLLSVAEEHTTSSGYFTKNELRQRLRAVTLNNLGCYYKKCNKFHTAIQYLEKALKIESTFSNNDNSAGTHLNICAIFSQLDKHHEAANHARCAVQLLKYEQSKTKDDGKNNTANCNTSVLAIAYYNLGTEMEHMKKFNKALNAFQEAKTIAGKDLTGKHPMIKSIDAAIDQVKCSLSESSSRKRTPRFKDSTFKENSILSSPRPVSPFSIRRSQLK